MVLGAPPVYEFVVAALRSAAYLLGAKLLLGLDLSHVNWASLALAVPLIVAAFSGLGLLAAATTMLVRRLNPVAVVIGSLSFFLSGVMYPVTVLPGWLRGVGRLLPLTHALAMLRGALLVGSGPGELREAIWRCCSSPASWRRSAPACSPTRSAAPAPTDRFPIISEIGQRAAPPRRAKMRLRVLVCCFWVRGGERRMPHRA